MWLTFYLLLLSNITVDMGKFYKGHQLTLLGRATKTTIIRLFYLLLWSIIFKDIIGLYNNNYFTNIPTFTYLMTKMKDKYLNKSFT